MVLTTYREYGPLPALAPWVKCLWEMRCDEGGATVPMRVLPDGWVDLAVYVQPGPLPAPLNGSTTSAAVIVGLFSAPLQFELPRGVHIVGACMPAEAMRGLYGAELREFTGRLIPIADVRPRDLLAEEIADGPPALAMFRLVAALEGRRRTARPGSSLVSNAVRLVRREPGLIIVRDLAAQLAISTRQLERHFLRELGLTPKHFARIVRFDRTVREIQSVVRLTWSQVALRHGYYDQAHPIREFRAFAQVTPAQYARPLLGAVTSHFYNTDAAVAGRL